MMGCAGQVIFPPRFLKKAFDIVRAAGGLAIADEVQVGFGRPGYFFWGFESQEALPDIVTLGKPIGNGHPIGAVITTAEIAGRFATGMEYFNTFGGNPVAAPPAWPCSGRLMKRTCRKMPGWSGIISLKG